MMRNRFKDEIPGTGVWKVELAPGRSMVSRPIVFGSDNQTAGPADRPPSSAAAQASARTRTGMLPTVNTVNTVNTVPTGKRAREPSEPHRSFDAASAASKGAVVQPRAKADLPTDPPSVETLRNRLSEMNVAVAPNSGRNRYLCLIRSLLQSAGVEAEEIEARATRAHDDLRTRPDALGAVLRADAACWPAYLAFKSLAQSLFGSEPLPPMYTMMAGTHGMPLLFDPLANQERLEVDPAAVPANATIVFQSPRQFETLSNRSGRTWSEVLRPLQTAAFHVEAPASDLDIPAEMDDGPEQAADHVQSGQDGAKRRRTGARRPEPVTAPTPQPEPRGLAAGTSRIDGNEDSTVVDQLVEQLRLKYPQVRKRNRIAQARYLKGLHPELGIDVLSKVSNVTAHALEHDAFFQTSHLTKEQQTLLSQALQRCERKRGKTNAAFLLELHACEPRLNDDALAGGSGVPAEEIAVNPDIHPPMLPREQQQSLAEAVRLTNGRRPNESSQVYAERLKAARHDLSAEALSVETGLNASSHAENPRLFPLTLPPDQERLLRSTIEKFPRGAREGDRMYSRRLHFGNRELKDPALANGSCVAIRRIRADVIIHPPRLRADQQRRLDEALAALGLNMPVQPNRHVGRLLWKHDKQLKAEALAKGSGSDTSDILSAMRKWISLESQQTAGADGGAGGDVAQPAHAAGAGSA